jgi:UDP-glucose:(heptosyl)LPS alpha-1,3-glucosyltransferase
VLLLASHNFRRKGLAELLAVAGRLAANGRPVHVMVAGRGRLAKWRAIAARHGLANRVTFLGGVSEMEPYYSAADVYVHPTYYDQCSLVILEAAASGLPIVTTRNQNGTAELFREGDEALTVADPWDIAGLHERLEALFDERLRVQLGLAARTVALRNPFERNVVEILALYDRKVGRVPCPRIGVGMPQLA